MHFTTTKKEKYRDIFKKDKIYTLKTTKKIIERKYLNKRHPIFMD